MDLVIKIPKEFEEEFNRDKFEGSLLRVASDIESFGFILAGRYELETITMLREAFRNCTPLPEYHGRIVDIDEVIKCIEEAQGDDVVWALNLIEWACSKRTIIQADKEGEYE